MNGQSFIGDDLCSSKKQAEQSAARKALEILVHNDVKSLSTQLFNVQITSDETDPPPSYAEVMKSNAIEHLPQEYADIERYMAVMVTSFGGRVRKIWAPDSDGLYKFEIAGPYRYCDNVQRYHKRNQIYFMVDPVNKTYYQMCHSPPCLGFRSITRNIIIERQASEHQKADHFLNQSLTVSGNVEL